MKLRGAGPALIGLALFALPAGAQSSSAKKTPADALKALLDKGATVLVIDVRSDEEVRSGSIPGAVHIPIEQLAARMKDVPRDVQLVFT
ncbi:MAG: rhodanese-like domain-containing protein [Betaproteobacteria bacterium]